MKSVSTRILAMLLVLALAVTLIPAVFAANSLSAVVDPDHPVSLSLYKYDFTSAAEGGIEGLGSFVSTGFSDAEVEEVMAPYVIQGVVFSYIKVADITTFSMQEVDEYHDMILYAMDRDASFEMLAALGLSGENAYYVDGSTLYFTSDTLADALSDRLAENASTVKNALEAYVADGEDMPETDAFGHSQVDGLEQGLYLVAETYVPENVKNTTAPFFCSLPMTTIDGTDWHYDVTVYPKNETNEPTLVKELREAKDDTGKNNGSNEMEDGFNDYGTGSDGDVIQYQVISTLPSITSNATALTTYTFDDVLSKGLEYQKNDVVIEWYQDSACTNLISSWDEASGKFSVSYGTAANDSTTMQIAMTASGLNEINNSDAVYGSDSLYRGYSDCTIRITYSCILNSSADTVYGDDGNPNTVTLTWKRTNTAYYDTLTDDCHVYTYGVDLLKRFSDEEGNFENVHFVVHNDTDQYWVIADFNEAEGIYYVTGHAAAEQDATVFVPTEAGKVIVLGLEDDAYTLTETATDAGYTLLKDPIHIVITTGKTDEICPICGAAALTATAKIDGNDVEMQDNNGSASATVALTVVNTKGFELPQTGDAGTYLFTVCGIIGMAAAAALFVLLASKRKSHKQ